MRRYLRNKKAITFFLIFAFASLIVNDLISLHLYKIWHIQINKHRIYVTKKSDKDEHVLLITHFDFGSTAILPYFEVNFPLPYFGFEKFETKFLSCYDTAYNLQALRAPPVL